MKTSYLMLLFFILIVQTFSLKYLKIQKKQDEDIDEEDIKEYMENFCHQDIEDCESAREDLIQLLNSESSNVDYEFDKFECEYFKKEDVYCVILTE